MNSLTLNSVGAQHTQLPQDNKILELEKRVSKDGSVKDGFKLKLASKQGEIPKHATYIRPEGETRNLNKIVVDVPPRSKVDIVVHLVDPTTKQELRKVVSFVNENANGEPLKGRIYINNGELSIVENDTGENKLQKEKLTPAEKEIYRTDINFQSARKIKKLGEDVTGGVILHSINAEGFTKMSPTEQEAFKKKYPTLGSYPVNQVHDQLQEINNEAPSPIKNGGFVNLLANPVQKLKNWWNGTPAKVQQNNQTLRDAPVDEQSSKVEHSQETDVPAGEQDNSGAKDAQGVAAQ